MNKSIKIFTTALISTTLVMPNIVLAENINIENKNINIKLEKKTVVLGDTSNISISFKEKPKSDSITINLLCYDIPLSSNLIYNSKNNAYEGTIEFNKDPEYQNIWKIDNIVINSEEPRILTNEDLEKLGLNLQDYNITQKYIINNISEVDEYKKRTSSPVKKLIGSTRYETSVKISQDGWENGSDKVILVNGEAIADGITATPLATTYDAPILLTYKNVVPQNVLDEIERLNPSEILLVGGDTVLQNGLKSQLSQNINAEVRRISGINRYETSLAIAKEIDDNHDVNKIYIANGFSGEIDALTIAAKAGQDKQPIILSEKDKIPNNTYSWLKNEGLKDAYFIGGENVLTTNVIHEIAAITTVEEGQSVYKNRVYGKDRHETNANVIKRFYTQKKLDGIFIAKSDILADALAAGPLAAKLNAPILINPTKYVSKYHTENLKDKSADIVYQVGGGISDSVISEISYQLSIQNTSDKTIIIDPGHGGKDSGAVNPIDKTQQEKNYVLEESLAATEYLNDRGINVILTRDSDITMDLNQRSSLSNSINADFVVSIHHNASNTAGNGVEIYYKYADINGGASKTIANNILNSILEEFPLRNRGLKTRITSSGKDYYHMIREVNSPSIIVESSFIDNENDQKLVNDSQKRKKLGIQIAKGIEKTVK